MGCRVARANWKWDEEHPDGKNDLCRWQNEAIRQRANFLRVTQTVGVLAGKLAQTAAVPAKQDAAEIPEVEDWVHEDDCPCVTDQCSIDCKSCTCEKKCEVPPTGWRCTREWGHEGPCAALPDYSRRK
jgi:hypothetical protein